MYAHVCAQVCMYMCAAAKLLQSCPTLCDPIDGSPPGSSVHGIFQAKVLVWGATSNIITLNNRLCVEKQWIFILQKHSHCYIRSRVSKDYVTLNNKEEVSGLPWWLRWQKICLQCKRPWVGKIPWRREWRPTPAFLPQESHGQRSLVGPWGRKELDRTKQLTLSLLR